MTILVPTATELGQLGKSTHLSNNIHPPLTRFHRKPSSSLPSLFTTTCTLHYTPPFPLHPHHQLSPLKEHLMPEIASPTAPLTHPTSSPTLHATLFIQD